MRNSVKRVADSGLKGNVVSALVPQTAPMEEDRSPSAVHTILVVDDSRAQRRVLGASLSRQGYRVIEAASGDEALELLQTENVDLILSDWMMPGMDGLELCQKFRAMEREKYGYFILLTSKTEKGAVAQGLDVGADDFLSKPPNAEELRARIAAGDRILRMERELQEKNRLVSATLAEISTLYDSLDRDLIEAREMQQALVRERFRDFGAAEVSVMLKPCGHVGGDLVGFFRLDEHRIAVFSIDVSGHGIASALLTARLASYLSEGSPEHNVALKRGADGVYLARPPSDVAWLLNEIMHDEIKSDHYFTLLLGYIDMRTGVVELTQCGHPNPMLMRADGTVEYIGEGGMPIGLIPGAQYDQFSVTLKPGERLMFYSDGFTECEGDDGEQLEEQGFEEMAVRNKDLAGADFFQALTWDLDMFCGTKEFPDDLSCAMIEFQRDR